MYRVQNNRGAGNYEVTIVAETDEIPFIGITIETENLVCVADLVITSMEEAEEFARDAAQALEEFKRLSAKQDEPPIACPECGSTQHSDCGTP